MNRILKSLRDWVIGPVPLSILLAFAIGAVFIVLTGADPLTGYASMIHGSLTTPVGWANTLQRAIPLTGMALAVAVAFRAGVLNLGTEGQMVMGGLAGTLVALYLPGPGPLVMVLACIVAMLGGAAWAALSALMRLWPGVPILITSLLLNYPAKYFASWLVRFPLKDPSSSMVATLPVSTDRQIPMLLPKSDWAKEFTKSLGSDSYIAMMGRTVNWSLVMLIVIVIALVFMYRRTAFGFESEISGLNAEFARYSGVNANKMLFSTMGISGALAGLMGLILVIGAPNTRMIEGALVNTNYAWTGLLVALLAMYRPVGVAAAGLFFGAIIAGSGAMGRELSMSPQVASVIQGIVIIFIALKVQLPRRWFVREKLVPSHAERHSQEPGTAEPTAPATHPAESAATHPAEKGGQ